MFKKRTPRNDERANARPTYDGGMLPRRNAKHLEGVKEINYKDYELLRKFMTERGKITPRRITGASARQQREIKRAIRRARVMGLLP